MKSNKRCCIQKIVIVSILTLILVLCSYSVIFNSNYNAEAIEIDNIESQSTNLGEMLIEGYADNAGGKVFDKEVFWELISEISNKSVSTIEGIAGLGEKPVTSKNFRSYNGNKEIVVTIGGKKWTATYLSKNSKGDPILTLWLANGETISTWSASDNNVNSFANEYTSNLYGTSYLRTTTLNNGGTIAKTNSTKEKIDQDVNSEWAIYTMPLVKGSIAEFIEVPNNVSWQVNQKALSQSITWPYSNYRHNTNNDALSTGGDGDAGDYLNKGVAKDYYSAWGNDKLWLPSVTETGTNNEEGMWLTSINQRAINDEYKYTWLRSANCYTYSYSYVLTSSGTALNDWDTNKVACVRPAFHLNLGLVAEKTGIANLSEPTDVKSVYNGQVQTLADIDELQKDWYDSEYIDITYPNNMKDAGTYQVTATIKENFANDGLVFKGDPDTSKGETVIKRFFSFTIIKKKIGVEINEVSGGLEVVPKAGSVYSGDTAENGRAPIFAISYKNNASGVTSNIYPTNIGTYTATVSISNDCNYELDKTYDIEFSIDKTKVAKPSIATREKPYTGSDITFNLTQMSDKVNVSVTGDTASYLNGVVTVRNAGTYTVTVSLADHGVSTCWDTTTADDIASYTIEIKVTQKKLNTDISCSESTFSWEAGDTPTMTITDERISGDNVDYKVYYLKSGDSTKYDDIDALKQVVGDTLVVTMPNDLVIGSYTFVVELNPASDSNSNVNYYIDGGSKTRQFTIVGNGITVTADAIKWKVNSVDIGQSASSKLTLTYNGNPFVFSVDESNLRSMGVKIDTSKGNRGLEGDIQSTNAGTTYSVTVWLCNYDNSFDAYSGSFTLNYEIQRAKYNLSGVKWNYTDGAFTYNGQLQTVTLTGLPSTLKVSSYDGNSKRYADDYVATVLGFENTNIANYVTPILNDTTTYEGNFDWTLNWSIRKAILDLTWASKDIGKGFKVQQVDGTNAQYIDRYIYYTSNGASVGSEISLDDIVLTDSAVRYWVEAVLTNDASKNYEIREATKRTSFVVGSDNEKITVDFTTSSFTYDGTAHGGEIKVTSGIFDISKIIKTYYKGSVNESNKLDGAPTDAGDYILVLGLSQEDAEEYELSKTQLPFTIDKAKITAEWDTSGQVPVLSNLSDTIKNIVGYIYYDDAGNQLPSGVTLQVGKTYKVKAIITGDNVNNYEFVAVDGTVLPSEIETQQKDFVVNSGGGNQGGSGSDVNIGSGGSTNSGGDGNVDFGKVGEVLAQWWQVIASVASIILIVLFMSKGIGYANKCKKAKKGVEKYSNYYAGATGLFGLAMTGWTAIACTLMGLAVFSLAFMLIEKSRYNKAQEDLDDAKEEYERNKADVEERKRDENMRMMLMGIMGGNNGGAGQGGYVVQQGLGVEEMRGLISETVTALLPGVQQALPQQASTNDELVQKLLAKTEKNEETMQKLMKKIADQPVEREVVATLSNDETIKQIMKNQEVLMQKILELSDNQNAQPQIVEKIVEVPVEVEKVVEKEVIKEVPVEKIVEKEVVKEVKVAVPVATPSKPKKETTPRLTLDEAYAQLSKQQQKYFDGLREYALTKDKCKEKKSTYFVLFGQSSVNPLMKLTIKKGMTVALFKMEDEYMKDIRRDASSDGTKVKVKETEVIISDAQACKTAKHMIDLREDQIERYQELLREQKALGKRK